MISDLNKKNKKKQKIKFVKNLKNNIYKTFLKINFYLTH
jgi:hypothetical protein